MIALVAVSMGFLGLLRWADLAVINIGSIFWTKEGVLVCIPIRKNSQIFPTWVVIADTHAPDSCVARLRDMVRFLGHDIPDFGTINTTQWLFRPIELNGRRGRASNNAETMGGHGRRAMGRKHYSSYLKMFRAALCACCKMSPCDAALFGTHSVRSGGDTHLFNMGFNGPQRRDIGVWASELVERGYLRLHCRQMFAMIRAACF